MNEEQMVEELLAYIEGHLKDELTLEEIEQKMGYSRFYLIRLFSQQTNYTIHKYIQMRRLTEAARDLVRTKLRIVDIAYEANYDSQQAFTLAFKKVYHVSPSAYRQRGIFEPAMEPFHKVLLQQEDATLKVTSILKKQSSCTNRSYFRCMGVAA